MNDGARPPLQGTKQNFCSEAPRLILSLVASSFSIKFVALHNII
jgi:hypothetical protein